jgi:rhodanese-related sulfurtransferase
MFQTVNKQFVRESIGNRLVIDVREPDELLEGRIPQSKAIPGTRF